MPGRDPMPRQASSENTKAFVLGMPLGFSLLVTPLDTLQWTLRHRWKHASGLAVRGDGEQHHTAVSPRL